MNILSVLPNIFGSILDFIYKNISFNNYGLAIIIFTIFTRLLILPLTIRQLRATSKMQELQPKLNEIQQKYKNDKEKLAQEQMKIYQEAGANPLSSCLPTLIQLPIIFSLYYAIIQPLTYQMKMTAEQISQLIEKTGVVGKQYIELRAAIADNLLNMNFLGLNLGETPKLSLDMQHLPYLIFPILATLFTFWSIKISTNRPGVKKGEGENQTAQMNNTMTMMMPLMTLWFSFIVPAALTLYWTTGYVIQIIQQLAINKFLYGKKEEENK